MGLDIYSVNPSFDFRESFHVGSYSGVQNVRRRMIELGIKYLEGIIDTFHEEKDEDEDEISQGEVLEIVECMKRWCKGTLITPIDYASLYKDVKKFQKELMYLGVYGIAMWCNHSDCDGYLSYGDICDINHSLELILKSVEENEEDYLLGKIFDLKSFLLLSVQYKGTYIVFA